jgi:tagatose-1,6-bisphosphate aldolase non-catalytic subunit AgaZ/GatZ
MLTDCTIHSQQAGIHAIATHTVDVGISSMAAGHAGQHRSHYVIGTTGPVPGVGLGAVLEEVLPSSTRFEELEKEPQRTLAGHRRSL